MIDIELIKKRVLEEKKKGERRLNLGFVDKILPSEIKVLEALGFKVVAGLSPFPEERDVPNPKMDITIIWENKQKHLKKTLKRIKMRTKFKKLRVEIDGLFKLTKSLAPSGQISEAYNSLLLGKAWLGKVLGELGTESPYLKDGSRHSVEDVEKTADVNEDIHGYNLDVVHFEDKNHIEKVDWLRQEIGKLCQQILPMSPTGTWERRFLYEQQAHLCLSNARIWLGFELQRIKKEEL